MARGRRDYISGFLLETGTGARYTESLYLNYSKYCAAYGSTTIATYTVPVGYRIALNTIILSSTGSVPGYFALSYGSPPVSMLVYFTESYNMRFSDQNPLYFAAGVTLTLTGHPNTYGGCTFYVSILGVLEQLKPD
jgi:hypothetical protein